MFLKDDDDVGIKHQIRLVDSKLIFQQDRRILPSQFAEEKQNIRKLLKNTVIRKSTRTSVSPIDFCKNER